jgi:FkbM family methyltransferase
MTCGGRPTVPSKNEEILRADSKDQSQIQECLAHVERLRESLLSVCSAVSKMAQHQTHLQSEITALSHRHVRIGEDLAGALESQQELSRNFAELSTLQKESASSQAALKNRLLPLESRSRLFLGGTDDGIFLLKSGDLISDSVLESHAWDKHILGAVETSLDSSLKGRNGLAIDVGAHIGVLTVPLARRFRRVVSFEPNAFNYRLLRANVALNGLSNVECINAALYSQCVELSLARSEQQEIAIPSAPDGGFDGWSASNLGAYSFSPNGCGIFSGLARTLDSYNLDDLAFLKIDAQGADGEVIAGAAETIHRCRPVIVFEWEDELSKNFQTSLTDVHRLIEACGYRIELLKEHNSKQRDFLAIPSAVA